MAVYATRLERRASAPADSAEIALAIGNVAKEVGEAVAAGVAAAQPGADRRQMVVAEKEIDDAIEALQVAKDKLHVGEAVH